VDIAITVALRRTVKPFAWKVPFVLAVIRVMFSVKSRLVDSISGILF
jgi:hypothetical protein